MTSWQDNEGKEKKIKSKMQKCFFYVVLDEQKPQLSLFPPRWEGGINSLNIKLIAHMHPGVDNKHSE